MLIFTGMKTNLKPCPLCSGKANIAKHYAYLANPLFSIYCSDCDIQVESYNQEELINRWNTRHDEMTLKKVLLLILELAIKILALAVLAAGVYWIFA